jgi:hypothetical protein
VTKSAVRDARNFARAASVDLIDITIKVHVDYQVALIAVLYGKPEIIPHRDI